MELKGCPLFLINKVKTNHLTTTPTFTEISANVFVDRKPRKFEEVPLCKCSTPAEDGITSKSNMSCLDSCLNRIMFIECTEDCLTGPTCSNNLFQKRTANEQKKRLQLTQVSSCVCSFFLALISSPLKGY